jgi:hypothetical protein
MIKVDMQWENSYFILFVSTKMKMRNKEQKARDGGDHLTSEEEKFWSPLGGRRE